MSYIARALEPIISEVSREYAALVLTGPRQVGKTTLLEHLSSGARETVTLDDLQERSLAQSDPELFLQLHPAPVLIDEVQYAPELFPYVKIAVDRGAPPGSYWMTGSQSFALMERVRESLAGRVALLSLPALSQQELYSRGPSRPFSLDLKRLQERASHTGQAAMPEVFERIWNGSMPGLASGRFTNRDVFYSSYLQTYINRDVSEQVAVDDKMLFSDFVRAAACRTGQMLNVESIARDISVSPNTVRRWLSVLERSEVIFYLRPYSNNLLKRMVKTPKLYFFDTGLVAYLTQYPTPQTLQSGAIAGAILENYVVSEIRKSYMNAARECLLWYYRDKDRREIDLVLESEGELHPIEIKKSSNPTASAISHFGVLDRASVPRGNGAVICMKQRVGAIDGNNFYVPVWAL